MKLLETKRRIYHIKTTLSAIQINFPCLTQLDQMTLAHSPRHYDSMMVTATKIKLS